MNWKHVSSLFAASLLAGSLANCKGVPQEFDCEDTEELLTDTLATRGALQPFVPEVPLWPMAMVFSEQGVNELLVAALGSDGIEGGIPDLSIEINAGPLVSDFTPIEPPEITLEHSAECENCVRLFMKYNLDILLGDMGIINGIGDFAVAIPLNILLANDTSYLVANFDQTILNPGDFHLTLAGINLDEYPGISEFMEDLILRQLQDGIGETQLVEMVPWTIGGDHIKLAAREVYVNPDERTMVIGSGTNLDIPTTIGLDTKLALPEGVEMGVKFHQAVILRMCQRMLEEGHIPRTYTEDGTPDPSGNIFATIENMSTQGGAPTINTDFRVWRTDADYCGYADVEMPLFLELENEQLGVRSGEIEVTGGQGVGRIAANNEEFVDSNKEIIEEFKSALESQVGITVNYKEFYLPGAVLSFKTRGVGTDSEGVNVDLEFDIVSAG